MSANRLPHGERVLAGRKGAHRSWRETDNPTARTDAARAAAEARFLKLADPEGVLPEKERLRRAKTLRAEFYADIQLKSAASRRLKRLGKQPPQTT